MRLSDVAEVVVDHQPLIGDAVVSGGDGLVLVVEKFPGADTMEVTEAVEEALEALAPGMSGIETDLEVFRPADYLEEAGGSVLLAGGIGAGLLVLVLVLLRRSSAAVVVTVASVVVSLAAAIVVLRLLGHGVNALVLLGLGGALALAVDTTTRSGARFAGALAAPGASAAPDASEREPAQPDPTERVSTAWRAAATPMVYAGLITVLGVVPLAVVAGRPGALLDPLVTAYLAAVLAAGASALLVAPALGSVLLGRRHAEVPEGTAHRWLRRVTASALARTGARPRIYVAGAAVLGVAALAVLPLLSVSLLPRFQDRDVLVRLDGEPGMSNPAMTALATDVAARIGGLPGVDAVGAHVGRAVTGDRVANVNSSDVWVALDDNGDRAATLEAIEEITDEVVGASGEVTTSSTRTLRDVGARTGGGDGVSGEGLGVLTGAGRALTVRVFGQDLAELGSLAEEVRVELDRMAGVVAPRVEMPTRQATIEIEVDLDRARQAGLNPGDVRRAEATLLQGIQVGSVFDEQKVFDVVVQGDPGDRGSVEAVSAVLIDTPDGGRVALGDVADVRVVDTPSVIEHDAVSRFVDVTADVGARPLDDVVADARTMLAGIAMPLEYHAEVIGTSTGEQMGLGRVVGFGVGALVAALLLLQAALRSWRAAGIVVALLVPALSGGLLAILVTGGTLDLGGLVGLLVVLGLATAHAVTLGSRVLDPVAGEADPTAALDSAVTAIIGSVAVVALILPAVVLGGRPGLELLHPMAVVVLGGVLTTVFVMSGLLPALVGPGTGRPAVPAAAAPPDVAADPASNGHPAPQYAAPGGRR